MPDNRKKISELTQIQNNQQGIPDVNIGSLMEVSEPQLQGTNYESKSMSLEQLRNFIFEKAFPVGCIYMSTENTNPESLFGGKWDKFAVGRTIFGVDETEKDDNNFKPGAEGGAKTVTLTENNLPQHTHKVTLANKLDTGAIEFAIRNPYQNGWSAQNPNPVSPSVYVPQGKGLVTTTTTAINKKWPAGSEVKNQPDENSKKADVVSVSLPNISTTATLSNVGSGTPISILPPYVTCYIWKRKE